jgi:hypothetical protein
LTAKTAKSESETKSENPPEKVAPKTRWVKNAFFNGGTTKYVRLDELHNELSGNNYGQGDFTDHDLAAEIVSRAGLLEHPRYEEIVDGLTEFFETIPDPAMQWINPNYGVHYPKSIDAK